MLPSYGCLVIVQKEPISSHPRSNSVQAVGHAVLKCFRLWRTTNTRIWVSSAYAWGISPWSFTSCSTSATYKTKRIGPRTDPCGTPYKTNDGVDLDPGVQTSQWQFREGRMTSAAAGKERRGQRYQTLQKYPITALTIITLQPVHLVGVHELT